MFKCSKLESHRDVSVTRIDYTLFYGFPQTVLLLLYLQAAPYSNRLGLPLRNLRSVWYFACSVLKGVVTVLPGGGPQI